jgi:hypothetical protein
MRPEGVRGESVAGFGFECEEKKKKKERSYK